MNDDLDDDLELPTLVARSEDWTTLAACKGMPADLFFTERGKSTAEAKAVCAGCPVREQCLDYAMANTERFGVWGGLSEHERRRLRAHQRRDGEPAPPKLRHALTRVALSGTESGFNRHRREGTPICDPCREARNFAERYRQAIRRAVIRDQQWLDHQLGEVS